MCKQTSNPPPPVKTLQPLKNQPPDLDRLRRIVREVPAPENLFKGLLCQQSLAPDNIIVFRRGDEPRSKCDGVGTNYHHRFELALVIEQAGPVRVDHATYLLNPAEGVLIFPNQFHHYMELAGSCEWLLITFDLGNAGEIETLRGSPRVFDQEALSLVERIAAEYERSADASPDTLAISFHLSRLLRHLCGCDELPADRRNIHSTSSARDVILEKIDQCVRGHLGESVTISDIAAELGYSVSHLRAVFRDRLGVSLGRYMREARLSEAAQLLQTSQFNVSEIGERCGFESLYAFSRAFRKAYGIPPRSYRQLVQAGRALPARQAATSGAA